jgi:hypothetical protein
MELLFYLCRPRSQAEIGKFVESGTYSKDGPNDMIPYLLSNTTTITAYFIFSSIEQLTLKTKPKCSCSE